MDFSFLARKNPCPDLNWAPGWKSPYTFRQKLREIFLPNKDYFHCRFSSLLNQQKFSEVNCNQEYLDFRHIEIFKSHYEKNEYFIFQSFKAKNKGELWKQGCDNRNRKVLFESIHDRLIIIFIIIIVE